MARARAAVALGAAAALALATLSGGSSADPRTPRALPGLPPPFLPVAVLGDGGLTAGVDAYGDVADLRPRPAGTGLVDNALARQRAGSVPPDTGIVPLLPTRSGRALPPWRASAVHQSYVPGSNALRTVAWLGGRRLSVVCAATGGRLACLGASGAGGSHMAFRTDLAAGRQLFLGGVGGRRIVAEAISSDRRWLDRSRPLGAAAPGWAVALYRRSLLVLRALTGRNGAVAAGPRDGWAHVWPRDAAAVSIALAASGHRAQARRVARFLLRLPLDRAARFDAGGKPVAGRGAEGDAAGWVGAAARAAGLGARPAPLPWRARPDYQEGPAGDYLGNALAALSLEPGDAQDAELAGSFVAAGRLLRSAADPGSGLDSAAAWAVRPFHDASLIPAARRTLLALARSSGRFGMRPSQGWSGGGDPWSAPTAFSAWSLAALGMRHPALRLLGELRRAETGAGLLPERVDARTGIPTSVAPLAWSHAFAILALRELWPPEATRRPPPRARSTDEGAVGRGG